ncbi:protein-glutamine gamma-glutamyltransferase 5 [Oryzias melastigma]|uniref:Protein-glutamine gamma-glutamyltransferase 5-like n=1 Tax=Oryzias melastigma TaxID=30732 RepID=A0A3B3DK47_ORYME|nr:protein-glutamine gamma-glutamyltransferase 5 [Oryzias melastigma]
MQQASGNISSGSNSSRLKLVNFENEDNHISHQTQGLSSNYLVVRRGKPFKVTLMFDNQAWNRPNHRLVLEARLGDLSVRIPVRSPSNSFEPLGWSAMIYPGDLHPLSVTVHICAPVQSSVALYELHLDIETPQRRLTYEVGKFVLLCNPWLKEDPVYMPLDVQLTEYVQSDYGVVYMGTETNVVGRPWSFGQYEPGVLEACLKLLQVSPQHLSDNEKDYMARADPVYLSRVVCAMVNCNDDLGILQGKWQGSYTDGRKPTDWSGSADILNQWLSSNCKPVKYGQCWVFGAVLCSVMRVLGVPSRLVTVFNAAHDTNGNVKVEEVYSTCGEKLNLSKDSIWNFHVWVECWMRRDDLSAEFDGWQVVDPTPQETSAGMYRCGPCPVAAILQRRLRAPYDAPFLYASVDADVIRLVIRDQHVVGSMVEPDIVGRLICTKSVGLDSPENLTWTYKQKRREQHPGLMSSSQMSRIQPRVQTLSHPSGPTEGRTASPGAMAPSLQVSLTMDKVPSLGEDIRMTVTVSNGSGSPRDLLEHISAQLKEYDSSPQKSFWVFHGQVVIQPFQVLRLHHFISYSDYSSILAGEDFVNLAVVMKDTRTKERFLAAQEFSIQAPQVSIEVEGGDSMQMQEERAAHVSFTNRFSKALMEVVLTVEGSGLFLGKQDTRVAVLEPGKTIRKKVSVMATSPGTKVLMATLSHSNITASRGFHKVSVVLP